jgi:hypothetical protein
MRTHAAEAVELVESKQRADLPVLLPRLDAIIAEQKQA